MNAMFNPEMVVLARQSRGLTQGGLADAIHVTQGLISKVESSTVDATIALIAEVARVLAYPVSFFHRSDRVRGSDSVCLHHRKRASMPARLLTQTESAMFVAELQIRRLLDDLELEPANTMLTLDPDEYSGDPREVARTLRRFWRVPDGPIPNLVQLIEGAGCVVLIRDFGTTKLDGMSCWPKGCPPLFFINSRISVDRMRFTLAHELGHLVMHATPPSHDPEDGADDFAAELLMPAEEIEGDLVGLHVRQLPGLKEYWRVSMAALILNAKRLGLLSEQKTRSLYVQLSQHGYRQVEPFPLSPEMPAIVDQAIDVHVREHGYTVDEVAAMVDMLPDEFRAVYLTATPEPSPRNNVIQVLANR